MEDYVREEWVESTPQEREHWLNKSCGHFESEIRGLVPSGYLEDFADRLDDVVTRWNRAHGRLFGHVTSRQQVQELVTWDQEQATEHRRQADNGSLQKFQYLLFIFDTLLGDFRTGIFLPLRDFFWAQDGGNTHLQQVRHALEQTILAWRQLLRPGPVNTALLTRASQEIVDEVVMTYSEEYDVVLRLIPDIHEKTFECLRLARRWKTAFKAGSAEEQRVARGSPYEGHLLKREAEPVNRLSRDIDQRDPRISSGRRRELVRPAHSSHSPLSSGSVRKTSGKMREKYVEDEYEEFIEELSRSRSSSIALPQQKLVEDEYEEFLLEHEGRQKRSQTTNSLPDVLVNLNAKKIQLLNNASITKSNPSSRDGPRPERQSLPNIRSARTEKEDEISKAERDGVLRKMCREKRICDQIASQMTEVKQKYDKLKENSLALEKQTKQYKTDFEFIDAHENLAKIQEQMNRAIKIYNRKKEVYDQARRRWEECRKCMDELEKADRLEKELEKMGEMRQVGGKVANART
ncbi:myosin heavy chain, non-muscle-like [Branchiostoma lanceolatum]|uniref:myosin heavy chain, non-muscle-like n=1 Tax=Branchiostoma lanceolatum TaxID=7740 RepID=UPI0034555ED3